MKPERRKQYFIAIVPPSPMYEEAQRLKEHFRDTYRSKAALNSPPHITLHMPFWWNEDKEKKLVTRLGEFVREGGPVRICLDNFSAFPPRVIFMAITDNEALRQLQKRLHAFFKTSLDIFNANYQDRPFHPHMTLAFRDLKKTEFPRAWEEFSAKEYKAEFIADRICLLKHDGKRWQVLKEFPLESEYSANTNRKLDATEG